MSTCDFLVLIIDKQKVKVMAKKHLFKRAMSILFTVCITVTMLPVEVLAAESAEEALVRQQLYEAVSAEEYPNGLIGFLTPQMECAEGQEFVEFVVARYGPTDNEATVKFKAIDISAKYGEDYYITIPQLFFEDKLEMDEDAQTIVEITADEANRSEVTLGETDTIETTTEETTSEDIVEEEILEVETQNENTVSSSDSIVESLADARTALLGVPTDTTSWQDTLSNEAAAEQLLEQNQSYYEALPGATYTFTFKPGENQKILRFYLKDDSVSESDEQVMFVLSNVNGSVIDPNPTGYMNITDNEEVENATYSFEDSVVFAEDGKEYVTATLLRTTGTEQYNVVTLGTSSLTAEPDVDYTSLTQQITFVPGQTQQTVRIPIKHRDRTEPLSFNLQVREDESDVAAVTVVLPANVEGLSAVYSVDSEKSVSNSLDPINGNLFWKSYSTRVNRTWRGYDSSCEFGYLGLEGDGTYKYRVYYLNGRAYAEQAGNFVEVSAYTNTMVGVEKIKFTIDDIKGGYQFPRNNHKHQRAKKEKWAKRAFFDSLGFCRKSTKNNSR